MLVNIFSPLLIVIYMVAILGFDIHTCHSAGVHYVVSLIENADCEEIHEGCCCDASCSDSSHGQSVAVNQGKSVVVEASCCCSDDVLMITSEADHNERSSANVNLSLTASSVLIRTIDEPLSRKVARVLKIHHSVVQLLDFQSVFSIYRI